VFRTYARVWVVAATLILLATITSGSRAADPYHPLGGGCYSPVFQGPGVNCGSPPPPPSPTPTPSATPTAFPHAPSELYDGQFGGIGVIAALIQANATVAVSTIENPGAAVTPKPISDGCLIGGPNGCVSGIYDNWTRNNHQASGNAVGVEFNNNCVQHGTSDDCYFHTVGPTPLPTCFRSPSRTPQAIAWCRASTAAPSK